MLRVSPLSPSHFATRVPSSRNLQSFNKVRGFYRVQPCRFNVDIRINLLIAERRGKSCEKNGVVGVDKNIARVIRANDSLSFPILY